jgi:hypothetical protein
MSAQGLQELEDTVAKLSAMAKGLPLGQERRDALREIGIFRKQIAVLQRAKLRMAQLGLGKVI